MRRDFTGAVLPNEASVGRENALMGAKLKKSLFYCLPYCTRRRLFATARPDEFQRLQKMRTRDVDQGASYKPFDQLQCVFVHIPKAAGISIGQALFGNWTGNHASVAKYQLVFSRDEFESYFKFTFVRNPWDRLFSAYHYLKEGGMNEQDQRWADAELEPFESFDHFVVEGLQKPSILNWKHFAPQTDFLFVPGSRKLQVDFLGLFENLQADFRHVAGKLGYQQQPELPHENWSQAGQHDHYRDAYTPRARRIVSQVYRRDVEAFGYEFDNASLPWQLSRRQRWTA